MKVKLFTKLFLISAAILFISINLLAEGKSQSEDRKKFEAEDKSFLVEFPASPEKSEFIHEGVEGKGYKYRAYKNGVSFYVFSYPKVAPPTRKNIKNPSPWFLEARWQTAMVFDEYKAESIRFSKEQYKVTLASFVERKGDPSTNVHRILNVSVGDRLLSFRVVEKFGSDPEAGLRFLESVRVGSGKTRLLTERPKWAKENLPTKDKSGSGIGFGSGRGSGAGSGILSGRSSGVGGGDGKAPVITPLKVTSIPKPGFTLLAKYYRISGQVLLRVKFLSDGTIGAVSPVRGLPFGLTEMAQKAARNIVFEPRKEDGKAVSVSRVIQFNFD